MKRIFSIIFILSSFLYSNSFESIKYENLFKISETEMSKYLSIDKETFSIDQKENIINKLSKLNFIKSSEISILENTLIISITEKKTLSSFSIIGFEDNLKEIIELHFLKKGMSYDDESLYNIKKQINELLMSYGYTHIELDIKVVSVNSYTSHLDVTLKSKNKITIDKINLNGASEEFKNDLLDIIQSKKKESFSWFYGRNDGSFIKGISLNDNNLIHQFYLERGYTDIKLKPVYFDKNKKNISIEFFINEGEKHNLMSFNYNISSNNEETIKKEITNLINSSINPKLNEPFNITKIKEYIKEIETIIKNKGFFFTKIIPSFKKKPGAIYVELDIKLNNKVKINDVFIEGNTKTLDRVIRRNLFLNPGDYFSGVDFTDSENALKRTGYFSNVVIKVKPINDTLIDLYVIVEETQTGSIMLGGGYNGQAGASVNAAISEQNIFGSSIATNLSFNVGQQANNFNFNLVNPSINDSKYSGVFNINYNTYSAGDGIFEIYRKNKGISLGLGYFIDRHTNLSFRYSVDKVSEDYSNSGFSFEYTKSMLTNNILFDNTDNFYFPSNGFKISNTLSYAGLGGDVNYIKDEFSYKYFKNLNNFSEYDVIFRHKFRIGYLNTFKELIGAQGFYLGGINAIRGFERYSFGLVAFGEEPYKKLAVNSIELSFPLSYAQKLRVSTFYDSGVLGKDKFNDIFKQSYGINFEWFSPFGPVQFTFTKPINPAPVDKTNFFQFNIGQSF